MKRIGLISDTHGYFEEDIIKYLHEVDEIWHAGDIGSLEVLDKMRSLKPTRVVYGNIDNAKIRKETSVLQSFEIEGLKVCITHIAGRPEKMPEAIKSLIKKEQPGLFICGHSHITLIKYLAERKLMWMNPGACGIHGFHKVRTFVRFSIEMGKCKDLEVIELNRYPSQSVIQEFSG
jgi:putative phosphoesterase